jgi:hypothetical protein
MPSKDSIINIESLNLSNGCTHKSSSFLWYENLVPWFWSFLVSQTPWNCLLCLWVLLVLPFPFISPAFNFNVFQTTSHVFFSNELPISLGSICLVMYCSLFSFIKFCPLSLWVEINPHLISRFSHVVSSSKGPEREKRKRRTWWTATKDKEERRREELGE